MTPMRVIEVNTCTHTGRPMVMLQVEGRDRWLAFYLPMNEANRLARCLGVTQCPCTPIFDLAEQLIGHLRATVVQAYLEGDERGISAGLVLERDGAELILPCHPGDALALAVRARVPIMARDSALGHARAAGGAPAADDLQDWLAQIRPADFGDAAAS
ncbi:MAG TPA: bifunctional nuclease domain-containing protein [Methylomirabilota bacterium]|jgi:bifunctional DNase/RNase